MSDGPRIPLDVAGKIADALGAELNPGCERVDVAGSIRRRRPEVGDIELLCIPRWHTDLLGAPLASKVVDELRRLVADNVLADRDADGRRLPSGERYRQYIIVSLGCKLDLYATHACAWGLMLALRTGPASFSQSLVTRRIQGGRLLDGYEVAGGRLRRLSDGALMETRDEHRFLETYCGGWVAPEGRA